MQDAFQAAALSPPEHVLARPAGKPEPLPYRRATSVCTDRAFVGLLNAYRSSGGVAPAEELLASFRHRGGPDVATLARWIVARQVIGFAWQARTWLPLFQFDLRGMAPRGELGQVFAELNAVCDECELASWFAMPNPALDGRSPVQVLQADFLAVVRAARIARFVADG
jgi:Protein of unknown function (DUF2384)